LPSLCDSQSLERQFAADMGGHGQAGAAQGETRGQTATRTSREEARIGGDGRRDAGTWASSVLSAPVPVSSRPNGAVGFQDPLVGVESQGLQTGSHFMPGCCASPGGQETRHAGFFPDHGCWQVVWVSSYRTSLYNHVEVIVVVVVHWVEKRH